MPLFTLSATRVSENVRAMKPGILDLIKWLIKQTHHHSLNTSANQVSTACITLPLVAISNLSSGMVVYTLGGIWTITGLRFRAPEETISQSSLTDTTVSRIMSGSASALTI